MTPWPTRRPVTILNATGRDRHPWEGIGARVADLFRAGAVDLEAGTLGTSCSCGACASRASAALATLESVEQRDAAAELAAHAAVFRSALLEVYGLAGVPPTPYTLAWVEGYILTAHRLIDELGVPLADLVRRAVLREHLAAGGRWPWCASGRHAAGCCPAAHPDDEDDNR